MATSNDHPGLPFIQAKGYTRGRADGPPLWIVVHDMEAGETGTRAESTAAYFANPSDGRRVSAHYCVDDNSVVQCVDLDDVAWTVGNRPGNYRGINIELAGFARQTRDEWLDQYGRDMFAQIAPLVRSDAARFKIPVRRCTIDDLVHMRPGITSHNDLRIAFGGTTHTDPGANFPWDYFINLLNGVPNMPTWEHIHSYNADNYLYALTQRQAKITVSSAGADPTIGATVQLNNLLEPLLQQFEAKVDELLARPPVESAPVDVEALAAALAGNATFVAALAAAVEPVLRDAVADLGEGGAAQVRADAD